VTLPLLIILIVIVGSSAVGFIAAGRGEMP
jgi:hypothetical protein